MGHEDIGKLYEDKTREGIKGRGIQVRIAHERNGVQDQTQ